MASLQNAASGPDLATIKAALTPDFHSRAAYVGQVYQTESVVIITEDGTVFEKTVSFPVSWDSISKMLEIIKERAGI
ncbi:hypothetical protein [Brucella anthropi]|uniref:hypothetical protein n=1 Tax=Brucella anthropi TaxID=529 RepID=UPI000F692B9B|nr:hypothetical protein [Brucella anthropi]RRY03846.1 hypothetical protein EGJ58_22355 [Brucella anthropi]